MSALRTASMLAWLLLGIGANAQSFERLRPTSWTNVRVAEPSDIAHITGTDRFFCVSDNGFIAEVRANGDLIRRSAEVAFDLEGAMLHEGQLLVVDERTRRVLWADTATLAITRRLTIPYLGGRNKGYEAIVWNPVKARYLLITERDPVLIIELDQDWRVVNEVPFDRDVRDISSAAWHDGKLWLLSDMDMALLLCDPADYRILARWELPILNPEGMTINDRGELLVLSDDRQRLYAFTLPTHAH